MSTKELKMLKSNFEHMLRSPLFAKMKEKIKGLEEERRILRRVILELGSQLKEVDEHSEKQSDFPENIKYELEETTVPILNNSVDTHKHIIKLEHTEEEDVESIKEDNYVSVQKNANERLVKMESSDEELDDDEFKCDECDTVQGVNNCQLCDDENVCEECYGQGGDYGPNEIWVCNKCLPTCNGCGKKLYSAMDECCNKGRSDIEEVYYQEYKCSKCGFITTSDDPDCSKCKKKACMMAITNDSEEEEEEEEEEVEYVEVEEEVVEEEEEVEYVEVEESEEEEEEEEEEDEEEEEEEEDEEEEVFEVTIKGKKYYTTDTVNGEIYTILPDGDIGDEVGMYKNGVARFA